MGARKLDYPSGSSGGKASSLRSLSFFCCLEPKPSKVIPSFCPALALMPKNTTSSTVRTAVPGSCILGPTDLLAAANVLSTKLLIRQAYRKEAPDARAETYAPGRRVLTRRGERIYEMFVLDLGCGFNEILLILSRSTRHFKAGGLGLASEKPLFHLHQFSVEKARLVLAEGQGLKVWPAPDEHLVEEWGDALYLKNQNAVSYDDSTVEYRMHVMATLVHLEEGYIWLRDTLKDKPGYDAGYIKYEWDEVRDLNPGPRYYAQMKPVRPEGCIPCEHEHASGPKAPIRIVTDRHIPTEMTGYWNTKVNKQGDHVPTTPNFEDLMKKFRADHPFVTMADSGMVFVYKDTHYDLIEMLEIKGYAYKTLNPKPNDRQRSEFLSLLKVNELRGPDWFNHGSEGLVNLKNGVYSIPNSTLAPHSKDHGFRYCLPYDYDAAAECPNFDQFMLDITKGRLDIVSVLQEFMGYAIAGGECYGEKALIMYGGGSNGKSTFMNVLKDLAGKDNYSSLSLTALQSDTKRYQIDGKLFNLGEETSVTALGKSEVFKAMVTGGEVDVKKLYVQDYSIKNRTKLIMACNELPKSSDKTHGLYRRMILAPFDAKFEGDSKDKFMQEKLKKELPGIFNFAMTGYKRLIDNRYRFTEGQTLVDALESYKLENDNVLAWANESIKVTNDDEDFMFKDEMYKSYKESAVEDGLKPFSKVNFFKSFHDKHPDLTESKRQELGLGTGRKRVLLGIRNGEL